MKTSLSFVLLIFLLSSMGLTSSCAMEELQHIRLPKRKTFVVKGDTVSWIMDKYFGQISSSLQSKYAMEKTRKDPDLLLEGIATLQKLLPPKVEQEKPLKLNAISLLMGAFRLIAKTPPTYLIKQDLFLFEKIIHVHKKKIQEGKLGRFSFVDRIGVQEDGRGGTPIPKIFLLRFASTAEDLRNLIAAIPGEMGDYSTRNAKKYPSSLRRKPFIDSFNKIKRGHKPETLFEMGMAKMIPVYEEILFNKDSFIKRCSKLEQKHVEHRLIKLAIFIDDVQKFRDFIDFWKQGNKPMINWIYHLKYYTGPGLTFNEFKSFMGEIDHLPFIKYLSIEGNYNNSAGNTGATLLAKKLIKNQLQGLFLCNNSIGDNGITAIAQALKKNTSLKTLCLGLNPFKAQGWDAIIETLLENNTLKHLQIWEDDDYGRGKIIEEICKQKGIEFISSIWKSLCKW